VANGHVIQQEYSVDDLEVSRLSTHCSVGNAHIDSEETLLFDHKPCHIEALNLQHNAG